jgi:maltose alpha-D-glucosyltransferase/alpha-amylase
MRSPCRIASKGYLSLVRVDYMDADAELYSLPLTYAPGARAADYPAWARLARLRREGPNREGEDILFDAFFDPEFSEALVKTRGRRLKGVGGEVMAVYTRAFREMGHSSMGAEKCSISYAEHSNTIAIHGERLTLKLYRRLEMGTHPEPELGRLLAQNGYAPMAPLAGTLTYYRERAEPVSLAILHRFVSAEGDAWAFTLKALEGFFERALASSGRPSPVEGSARSLMALAAREAPDLARSSLVRT